jgi:release factor glutamine methyltransferase
MCLVVVVLLARLVEPFKNVFHAITLAVFAETNAIFIPFRAMLRRFAFIFLDVFNPYNGSPPIPIVLDAKSRLAFRWRLSLIIELDSESISRLKLLELINRTAEFFSSKGIDSPRLQIELLLSYALSIPRLELYLQFDRVLTEKELDRLRVLVRRRADREPIQYIVGETHFCGLKFLCRPGVLIPRPETELLVEWVVESLQGLEKGIVVDVGTGSGAIAIALARKLPEWTVMGIDACEEAIALAKENVSLHAGTSVILLPGRFLEPHTGVAPYVVANLPYLTAEEMDNLQHEARAEPVHALSGGRDGLDVIRQLIETLPSDTPAVFLEVGRDQAEMIGSLLNAKGFQDVEIREDYHGVRRFLRGARG